MDETDIKENEQEDFYEFTGVAEYERYYNNNYGVYNISCEKELPHSDKVGTEWDENTSAKFILNLAGNMQQLFIGCKYKIKAKLSFNVKYHSWQYEPSSIVSIKPTSLEDSKRYLSSILTKKQADTLLNAYPDIIERILKNKEVDLNKTPGIKEITFNKIKQQVINNYCISDLLIMLQPLGISKKTILKISNLSDNMELLKQKIKEDPYILTQINGLGFKKVDNIAIRINPNSIESYGRLTAYIIYFFKELGNNEGDTWCLLSTLKNGISNNIIECKVLFDQLLENPTATDLIKINKILVNGKEKEIVGLGKYYKNEIAAYSYLEEIDANSNDLTDYVDFEKALTEAESKVGFKYTDEQKDFAKSTLTKGVTLLKANAGGGKTSCISLILSLYRSNTIALCSLSAKAARRMEEVSNMPAHTIHSLLGYGLSEDKNQLFAYNKDNKLPFDIIVLDEASMVNVDIFLALVQAIKPTSKIIIIFDDAQLPPIGYGNIATDLLLSHFNVRLLTKVHRQGLDSGILTDANIIRKNINPLEKPALMVERGNNKDLCYMFRNDKEQIRKIAIKQYLKWVKEIGLEETVIIVPRKKECINSTLEINKIIEEKLIPYQDSQLEINRKDCIFKVGCRIINRVNDRGLGIINGEVGYMTNIYTKEIKNEGTNKVKKEKVFTFYIDGGRKVDVPIGNIGNFDLAYALTCHSCLPEDTYIYTSDGLKQLKDLNNGAKDHEFKDFNNNINVFNGKYLEHPSKFYNAGMQNTKILITDKGSKIEGTLDHGLMTIENNQFKRIDIKDIKIGDSILINYNQNIYGNKIILPNYKPKNIDAQTQIYNCPTKMTKDFAEFLGLMCGDGIITSKGIKLVKRHLDVVEEFKRLMYELFGYSKLTEIKKINCKNAYCYEVSSIYINEVCKLIYGIQPNNKDIPLEILSASKENQCAFLKGLFENGTVSLKKKKDKYIFNNIEFSNKNYNLVYKVHLMLLNIGIKNTIQDNWPKYNYKLYISGNDALLFSKYIGFISKFKQDRLKLAAPTFDKITYPVADIMKIYWKKYRTILKKYSRRSGYIQTGRNTSKQSIEVLLNVIEKENLEKDENYYFLKQLVENFYLEKVIKIDDNKKQTYCLTMPETHNFIQNGFYGWNCQGSEYKNVICILDKSHYNLLSSNLLYTMITRAKKRCLVLAQPQAFNLCIKIKKSLRKTWLRYILKIYNKKKKEKLIDNK